MEEFEKKLIDVFNENTTLPFEVKRYVLKHVKDLVDCKYQMELLTIENNKLKSEVSADEQMPQPDSVEE